MAIFSFCFRALLEDSIEELQNRHEGGNHDSVAKGNSVYFNVQ